MWSCRSQWRRRPERPAAPLKTGANLTVVPPALYAGTNRADTLNGTSANDVLRGRGGNDTLHGRGGNDLVDGGPATIAPTATPVATTSSAASGTIVCTPVTVDGTR